MYVRAIYPVYPPPSNHIYEIKGRYIYSDGSSGFDESQDIDPSRKNWKIRNFNNPRAIRILPDNVAEGSEKFKVTMVVDELLVKRQNKLVYVGDKRHVKFTGGINYFWITVWANGGSPSNAGNIPAGATANGSGDIALSRPCDIN